MSTDVVPSRFGWAGSNWPAEWIRSTEVCRRTGCTYRQLDYWTRAGLVKAVYDAQGSGSVRGYELTELFVIQRIVHLAAAGLDVRVAAAAARQGYVAQLSDTVYVTVLPGRMAHA